MGSFFRLICCLAFIISGCAQRLPVFSENMQRDIELTDIPFFVQKTLQCGPAALAMVLKASGVEIDPDRLAPQIYLPDRGGTLQLELIGAVRRHGRIPYVIDTKPDALFSQLLEGRPVLILQDLGAGPLSRYHYAVVVGILPGRGVVLRSGSERRLVMDEDRFLHSWQRGGTWGLVTLRPGEIPIDADPDRYVKEIIPLESLGQWDVAEQGYQAALARWPDQLTALFGLGNTLLVKKEYEQAEKVFRKLLEKQPENPAILNNLAEAFLRQGLLAEALTTVDQALTAKAIEADLLRVLQQTRREILDASSHPVSGQ